MPIASFLGFLGELFEIDLMVSIKTNVSNKLIEQHLNI